MTRPQFGQRLPRPRRTQPVPLHQLRLDTVLRVTPTRNGERLLYLLPGGAADAPPPAASRRVAA